VGSFVEKIAGLIEAVKPLAPDGAAVDALAAKVTQIGQAAARVIETFLPPDGIEKVAQSIRDLDGTLQQLGSQLAPAPGQAQLAAGAS
jgi:hypothetical protein